MDREKNRSTIETRKGKEGGEELRRRGTSSCPQIVGLEIGMTAQTDNGH